MSRLSKLTRASILVAFFFGIDKIIGFGRLILVARQFKLSPEFSAFNVANNIPDLLFMLISGGALAMAFIPVLTETLTKKGRDQAWDLFSRVANFAFLVTGAFALVVALLADPLVRIVVAPGFTPVQQNLVIELMRLNLIATLIFSISGLIMAGLQANQHFLLPAMAPLLYNLGQLFGALILAPENGLRLGPVHLPAFGMGIQGLVYGVILGAALHMLIQIPGLARYGFHWTPRIGLGTAPVRRVLVLLGPRVITMLLVQLTFIVRDNLGSRLGAAAPTLLTYGWTIMQVPETLIGTAIGIAILPTLSELVARDEREAFQASIQRAMQVIIAVTVPIAILLMVGLRPLLAFAFDFGTQGTESLLWVTRGFLLGLTGQCLKEVAVRSFYARRDAITPLITAGINLVLYIVLGIALFRRLGAPGISLTDSLAFTSEAIILTVLLNRRLVRAGAAALAPGGALLRALLAALIGGGLVFLVLLLPLAARQPLVMGLAALGLGGLVALFPISKEIRLLLRL
jgi:putative peptidoglycan lipid II flippase